MSVLSIVFDSYISFTKLRNYFHNALVHKQLNWSKKIKIGGYRQKHLLYLKSFSLLSNIFDAIDYQLFRKVIHQNKHLCLCYTPHFFKFLTS